MTDAFPAVAGQPAFATQVATLRRSLRALLAASVLAAALAAGGSPARAAHVPWLSGDAVPGPVGEVLRTLTRDRGVRRCLSGVAGDHTLTVVARLAPETGGAPRKVSAFVSPVPERHRSDLSACVEKRLAALRFEPFTPADPAPEVDVHLALAVAEVPATRLGGAEDPADPRTRRWPIGAVAPPPRPPFDPTVESLRAPGLDAARFRRELTGGDRRRALAGCTRGYTGADTPGGPPILSVRWPVSPSGELTWPEVAPERPLDVDPSSPAGRRRAALLRCVSRALTGVPGPTVRRGAWASARATLRWEAVPREEPRRQRAR